MTISTGVLAVLVLILLGIIRSRGRANAWWTERSRELGVALVQCERKTRELENTLSERERKIASLQSALRHTEQELEQTSRSAPALNVEASSESLKRVPLPADGKEAFSPVLERERVYKMAVDGTCAFRSRGFFDNRQGQADGLYCTDDCGAFSERHDWLYLDDESLEDLLKHGTAKLYEEDREAHRYVVHLKGGGRKVGISLRPDGKTTGTKPSNLALGFELLPEGTPLPKRPKRVKTSQNGNGPKKQKQELPHEYRERMRQAETIKTDDELAQIEIALERNQKIVEKFQAKIDAIQKEGLSDENKKMLIEALRALLAATLKAGAHDGDAPAKSEAMKVPHVL